MSHPFHFLQIILISSNEREKKKSHGEDKVHTLLYDISSLGILLLTHNQLDGVIDYTNQMQIHSDCIIQRVLGFLASPSISRPLNRDVRAAFWVLRGRLDGHSHSVPIWCSWLSTIYCDGLPKNRCLRAKNRKIVHYI